MPRRGRGFWFSLAIDVLWPIVVLFVRLRVRGRQHVPGNGGVILAFDHLSARAVTSRWNAARSKPRGHSNRQWRRS
ncbi:hypothetical protein C8D88_103134 [Lentzea atacamensis]|uniref:Uncharacterized protein n=1 Tax=Lentzea atacamensis TaxID=531938 RepID=A0A316I603_9PSEU|nr:hypothetical protein C8D88_103134 [Lentzea atacamensis]